MDNAHEDFSVHVTVGTAAAERASGADVDHDTIIRISSEARRARAAPVGGWLDAMGALIIALAVFGAVSLI